MALSFAMEDTRRRTSADPLFDRDLAMDEKRSRTSSHGSPSPPLNNTHSIPVPPGPNSASSSAASLFSGMSSAAAVASLWQQQILLAAATANPLLSRFSHHHQNFLQPSWTPPSPPSPLPGPLSPALSNASSGSARGNTSAHPSNNNSAKHLNNNAISGISACDSGGLSSSRRKFHEPDDDQQYYVGSQKRQRIAKLGSTKSPGVSHDTSETQKKQLTDRGKRFTCTICNKSFGYKHVLQNHQRTHTKEKPFECPVCHQKFSRDHHMKTHVRLHTGERPYSCSVCNRGFVQVANLRRHMRVHTGERPYSCKTCSMKFSDSNQLKTHQLSHTTGNVLQCKMCHKQFRRSQLLINHKCIIASATSAVAPSSRDQKQPQPSSPSKAELDSSVHVEGVKVPDMTESFIVEPCLEGETLLRAISTFKSSNFFRAFMSSLSDPSNLHHMSVDHPEQTEPKDLSMPRARSRSNDIDLLYRQKVS